MFHVSENLCIGGAAQAPNEDRLGWGDNFLFVIDGATGLTGQSIMGGSDAAWLAERTAQYLTCALPQMNLDLAAILQGAAARQKSVFDARWQKVCPGLPPDYPSAGMAVFRLRGDRLEYAGLGDCTAVVELVNGRTEVLSETALTDLDQVVLEQMADLTRTTGCTMAQAREQVNDLLIAHRNLKNTPDGYWIFDPSGAGIPHARRRSWLWKDVASFSAMTDGFAQLVSPFGLLEDLPALHKALQTQSLKELSGALFSAQNQDWSCSRFPRFKPRDDTAVIWAAAEHPLH
jgi:hypothetical protein